MMDSVLPFPSAAAEHALPPWGGQPWSDLANSLFPSRTDYHSSWDQGWLGVGDGHRIWYEQCGNADGTPLLFIHGGPGSGFSPRQRELFDLARFRLIFFDQRGCGRSTPGGALDGNHTAALVDDIERLRAHLGIDRWLVYGTSWGSTLALAYCAQHRRACLGTVLRGIFLGRGEDIDWFFEGAASLFPRQHGELARCVEASGRLAERICTAVLAAPDAEALEIVRQWMRWEQCLDGHPHAPLPELDGRQAAKALEKYRIQAHFLRNNCFLAAEQWKVLAATFAGQLPVHLVHGREDYICRPEGALALHRRLPGSRLSWVEGAGHDPFHPAMRKTLRTACATFLR